MRAKWNEKLSALLFPSRVAALLRLLCVNFVVLSVAFTTNRVRARDELSRLSLRRVRALQIAQRRIERCVKFTLRLYSFSEKKRSISRRNMLKIISEYT